MYIIISLPIIVSSYNNVIWICNCKINYIILYVNFHILLTLKAPITTAADDKFLDIFPNFRQK